MHSQNILGSIHNCAYFAVVALQEIQRCGVLASVAQRLDNPVHWINRYPVDKCLQNEPRYPLVSDLSSG